MTVNERAVKLCKEILYGDPDPRTVSSMAAAMTEAVAEEREGCAATLDLIADQCEARNPVLAFELRRVAKIFIRTRFQYVSPEPQPPANKVNK